MGSPSAVAGNSWSYGYSFIAFDFDRRVVVGYNNISNNLKVAVLPSQAAPKQQTFGLGSSIDQVLSAQGTPTAVYGDIWSYGYSSVTFNNGVVSGYNNSARNLKIR